MADYYNNINAGAETFLDEIWEHILIISRGECKITDEIILKTKDEKYRHILGGLQMLHEDLEENKLDFVKKLEAEYKLEALREKSDANAKKMEADHQIELLKKKNEELAQFNYVASHDLQEPLRTITSFSDLLQKKYAEKLDREAQTYLSFILESAHRMSTLIFDLLNYSRIGADYELKQIDCHKIVDSVLQDLEHIIEKTKPSIKIAPLPVLHCNRTGMHQVFQNLIGNALKFKKTDTQAQVCISVQSDEKNYIFSIADNGIGIEPAYRERIFGIFQRLHTKDQYDGTGIGLASCKKIVEMHHGEIWLDSELGEGSTFYFSIPKTKSS